MTGINILFHCSPTHDTPGRLDFFEIICAGFGEFIDTAVCAQEKESRAQHHKCLLFFLSEQGLGMGSGSGPWSKAAWNLSADSDHHSKL